MNLEHSPERWANMLTRVWCINPGERFPVDVGALAIEYSRMVFPDDPLLGVRGDDLPGFDGGLYRVPKGWAILYNNSVASRGRVNFTLAHELGHYLVHRRRFPNGMECKQDDVASMDNAYRTVEREANVFAANLLMPLDDFRAQIPARSRVSLDMLSHCADRYQVSLIAATLRWLAYTERRAVVVVAREGYMLWSRSSEAARKTGACFRTSGAPVELPPRSFACNQTSGVDGRSGIDHGPGVWFREPVREITVISDQYDFSVSLLLLENDGPSRSIEPESPEEDLVDRIGRGFDRSGSLRLAGP